MLAVIMSIDEAITLNVMMLISPYLVTMDESADTVTVSRTDGLDMPHLTLELVVLREAGKPVTI